MDREIEMYILCVASVYTFADAVTEKLKQGFEPYGNPFAQDSDYLCQAMVKYKERDIPKSFEGYW